MEQKNDEGLDAAPSGLIIKYIYDNTAIDSPHRRYILALCSYKPPGGFENAPKHFPFEILIELAEFLVRHVRHIQLDDGGSFLSDFYVKEN